MAFRGAAELLLHKEAGAVLISPVLMFDDGPKVFVWAGSMGLTECFGPGIDADDLEEFRSDLVSKASDIGSIVVHLFDDQLDFAEWYAAVDGSEKARRVRDEIVRETGKL